MTGFANENEIIYEINNSKFKNLSDNLKKSIVEINDGITPQNISAKKYGGSEKADFSLKIDEEEYFISVKKGTGNSVHQEPIEEFITYLRNEIEDNEAVFNDLRHFIWGDGTYDGTGKVENRINALRYKKEFPERIENIQTYFEKYKEILLDRFLVSGAVSKNEIDYLYYGNKNECNIVSKDDLLDYAKSVEKKPISIGVLTLQAWNRNIKGRDRLENRRGQIQLKWGSLKKDIQKI